MTSNFVKFVCSFVLIFLGTVVCADDAIGSVSFDQDHYYCQTGETTYFIATVYPGLMGPEYTWRFYGFSPFGPIHHTTPAGYFPMVVLSWAFTEPGDHQISVWVRRESDGAEYVNTAWVHVTQAPLSPSLSTVELTADETDPNYVLTTCPAGDVVTHPYQYLKIKVKDVNDCNIAGIPASSFSFDVTPEALTNYYGDLSLTFSPVDSQTNSYGEIRFEIVGDTSIVGWINIAASIDGVTLDEETALRCNSPDMDCSGHVGLTDLTLFSGIYHGAYDLIADFYWDGAINLSDLTIFAQHYGHNAQ